MEVVGRIGGEGVGGGGLGLGGGKSLALQGTIENCDYIVDSTQTATMAELLGW